MGPQPTDIANTLSLKFEALHEAFSALAHDAAEFQNSVPVTDPSLRGLFNSLTRIVAFSDHVHVALNLMGEDVRAIETTYGEPARPGVVDLDERFDEWFTKFSGANVKVH